MGDKLGTKVSIGRVNLGFLNRIVIDDFIIYDQEGECMLRIGRLSVKAEWSALLQKKISISSAQLFGAHANIYKANADSPMNYQFVVDSLASNDTVSNSPLNLRINSLIIRHSSFVYNQKEAPSLDKFDTNHLNFNNISAHIILKSLSKDSLNFNVKRIALEEASGLQLSNLTFKAEAGKFKSILTGFALQLPQSTFHIDTIAAFYNTKHIEQSLRYRAKGIALRVTLNDLAFLIRGLQNEYDVVECTTRAEGTFNELRIPMLNVNSTNDLLTLRANVRAAQLRQKHPIWLVTALQLSINNKTVKLLKKETDKLPELLSNIGWMNLRGRFEGNEKGDIQATSIVETDLGNINAAFRMNSDESFTGNLKTNGINLKQLLSNKNLNDIAAKVNVKGNKNKINITGVLPFFDYNNYSYKNIDLNLSLLSNDLLHGNFNRISATGKLRINDENLKTLLRGEWKKTGKNMWFGLEGTVRDLAPMALNLSNQWNRSVFSASFTTNISASNLNDAQGSIRIYDFSMSDSTDVFKIESIHLTSGYNADEHFLKLRGDMGHIDLTGQFDWNTLPQSFINVVGSHLPTLPGLPPLKKNITNNFDIAIQLNSSRWLQRLLGIPLNLEQPLTMEANINDLNHSLNINGDIPSFSYDGASYQNAEIRLISPVDSILCNLKVKKLMDDGTGMDIQLKATASENHLTTNLSWNNHAKGIDFLQGIFNASTQLYTNDSGKAEAHVHIQSSNTTLGETTWDVTPSDIIYSDERLIVDRFSIEHQQQHITIDGVASQSTTDTLTVDLNRMDVSYILDLINFHPVEFGGKATGKIYATQLFDTPKAWTSLLVEDFKFENGRMGTLYANAKWNDERQQIDIDAKAEESLDARTIIKGYVSPVREDILLDIEGQGTNIEFLKTYTESFLKNISGQAYGNVKLVGPLGNMDLLGTLVVDGQADVIPLGTTYTLKKDTVRFVHNDIKLDKALIYDKYDNMASISGGIHHEYLSNMTFDLDIETSRLLAYDFSDFGNELFCGSVVASGKIDLHGRPGETTINCDATPLRPSTFSYNASSSGNVSSQEFITWHDKGVNVSVDSKEKDITTHQDFPSDLFLNFRINATPETTVRLLMDSKTGDYITLNGSGVINASYHNNGAFQMFGTYRVDRGTYGITIQNIIKKNFKFNEGGTIVFGGSPMEANLQLQAVHTVNGVSLSDLNLGNSFSNNTVRVNCLMNILGQPRAPRIEFDLDIPNVNSEEKQMIRSVITGEQEMNQQVLYLLGIGRFYTQDINNASSQNYDQTQLAMQSFLSGTLSSQINEVISHVVKNDNWNFGANISTGNEGWHNAEYEGIVSGRMLNNRLLINGQFGYRDNATRANPSFIGDFDIRYLLMPSGNLALKVYNQTNDRYFTRSSLNTQGIGIIIKRDFDGLSDLFFRKKKTEPSIK